MCKHRDASSLIHPPESLRKVILNWRSSVDARELGKPNCALIFGLELILMCFSLLNGTGNCKNNSISRHVHYWIAFSFLLHALWASNLFSSFFLRSFLFSSPIYGKSTQKGSAEKRLRPWHQQCAIKTLITASVVLYLAPVGKNL